MRRKPRVVPTMAKPSAVGQSFFRDPSVVAAAVLLSLIWAPSAHADVTAGQALAKARRLTAQPACETADERDEILVCARRTDLYRIPSEGDGGRVGDTRGRAGEVRSASPERLASGSCGIFGRTAVRQSGGKSVRLRRWQGPISVILGVGKALFDPE